MRTSEIKRAGPVSVDEPLRSVPDGWKKYCRNLQLAYLSLDYVQLQNDARIFIVSFQVCTNSSETMLCFM